MFFLTNNKEVVKCMNIVKVTDDIILIGKKYDLLSPLFIDPINSTLLDIFVLDNLSLNLKSWRLSDLTTKQMVLENDNTLNSYAYYTFYQTIKMNQWCKCNKQQLYTKKKKNVYLCKYLNSFCYTYLYIVNKK